MDGFVLSPVVPSVGRLSLSVSLSVSLCLTVQRWGELSTQATRNALARAEIPTYCVRASLYNAIGRDAQKGRNLEFLQINDFQNTLGDCEIF